MNADEIIRLLELAPHPEGGSYRETYRHVPESGGRGAMTLIYFLLRAGAPSRWHRVDAVESWHFYAGAPLALEVEREGGVELVTLGSELAAGHRPQAVVPAYSWQRARSLGAWSLVGCVVAPAFEFSGFELRED